MISPEDLARGAFHSSPKGQQERNKTLIPNLNQGFFMSLKVTVQIDRQLPDSKIGNFPDFLWMRSGLR